MKSKNVVKCFTNRKMKEINKVTVKSERVKCFDEKIEGYKKCGSTDKKFDCKKDCLISHNAVLSYIN